jgi:hypothetical protein
MTVRELKELLEECNDHFPVVAYTPDGNVVDIYLAQIDAESKGKYNGRQHSYKVSGNWRRNNAVLISTEPPEEY